MRGGGTSLKRSNPATDAGGDDVDRSAGRALLIDAPAGSAVDEIPATVLASGTVASGSFPSLAARGADESAATLSATLSSTVDAAAGQAREAGSMVAASCVDIPHSSEASSSRLTANKAETAPPPAVSATNSKPGRRRLKDGHCRIGFATSALCSECANAEMRAA